MCGDGLFCEDFCAGGILLSRTSSNIRAAIALPIPLSRPRSQTMSWDAQKVRDIVGVGQSGGNACFQDPFTQLGLQ